MALKSGDSRVVRFAREDRRRVRRGRRIASVDSPADVAPHRSRRSSEMAATAQEDPDRVAEQHVDASEALIYVTTPNGVNRVRRSELTRTAKGRRWSSIRSPTRFGWTIARFRSSGGEPSSRWSCSCSGAPSEGLSAEEILRAAGGPGPESADAEHRVRVLISRVRDLLGDPAAIERVRDAGEYGKTRYRLSGNVRFVLIEPLFTSQG